MFFKYPYILNRRRRGHLRVYLVMMVIMAVVNMGCYVWLDNAVAVIPDDDPTTMVQIELYDDNFTLDDSSDDVITASEKQGLSTDKAQKVVRGNGCRDDNRTGSYSYKRVLSATIFPKAIKASSTYNERYTAIAYSDFGHLKVMPVADGIANIISSSLLASLKGLPCISGGLFDLFFAAGYRGQRS